MRLGGNARVLLAEAKLNVLPLPTHGALVNVRYASFDAALRDAQALVPFGAASIETVDSKVLGLAQEDLIWEDVRAFFPEDDGERAAGVNLIEFVGDSEAEVEEPLRRLTASARTRGPDLGTAAGSRWRAARRTSSASGRCARNRLVSSAT